MSPKKNPARTVEAAISFESTENVSAPSQEIEVFNVEKILRGNKSISLLHRGEVYRLQVTRQGKLLLTK